MTKSPKVCYNSRLPTWFPTAVPNSVVSLTPHTVIVSLTRSNSYAMLMRLIFHRRFCVGTVSYNRFSRMFARKYNNDSNLFTHAQIRQTLFLKIFNDIVVRCYSSTERLPIACVSWKPRKFKLPGWHYEQFWRSEPFCEVSRTYWKCIKHRLWSQRELGTSGLSFLLDQPTWRYY